MDVHKPKPWHNWREFLKEYVIIVIGVLTALAAEQAAETMHERALAREAEGAIREEMAENVSRLQYRLSNQECIEKRLDDISTLLTDWSRGKEIPATIRVGSPGGIVLNDQRWQANLNSERFSRESASAQAGQAGFYTLLRILDGLVQDEGKAWDQLRALDQGSQFLTPAYRPKVVEALVTARARANAISHLGGEILRRGKLENLPSYRGFHPVMAGTTCQPLVANSK